MKVIFNKKTNRKWIVDNKEIFNINSNNNKGRETWLIQGKILINPQKERKPLKYKEMEHVNVDYSRKDENTNCNEKIYENWKVKLKTESEYQRMVKKDQLTWQGF